MDLEINIYSVFFMNQINYFILDKIDRIGKCKEYAITWTVSNVFDLPIVIIANNSDLNYSYDT